MLEYAHQTEGETDAFQARKLPPGAATGGPWERVGVRPTAPDVDPQRAREAGRAGDTGTGEASWRRRLAPHHREVVRRFFSDER